MERAAPINYFAIVAAQIPTFFDDAMRRSRRTHANYVINATSCSIVVPACRTISVLREGAINEGHPLIGEPMNSIVHAARNASGRCPCDAELALLRCPGVWLSQSNISINFATRCLAHPAKPLVTGSP